MKTIFMVLAIALLGTVFSGCVVRAYTLADELYIDPYPVVYGPTVYVDPAVYVSPPYYGHVHSGLRQAPPRGYYSAPPARRYGPPPGAYPPRRRWH